MQIPATRGAVLVFGIGLAVAASAAKPSAVKEVPVTVTLADGHAITGDGYGPYTDGADAVSAVLVSSGNLALKTSTGKSSLVRVLSLDFTVGCVAGPCDTPFDVLVVPAFVSTSGCQDPGGLRDMARSSAQTCNLNVNFTAAGLGWFLRFGEYAGTTPATVARHADGSWTVDIPEGGVARVLSYPTKGRMVLTERGDYLMTAHSTVAEP